MYVIGVDTGGSKSRCIVVDESYTVLGAGEAGPGNYRVAGTDGARENVETAIREALADAGVSPTETIVGGFGMGTLDTEEDRRIISEFLAEIDFVDEIHLENDVVTAYFSITAGAPGVVTIAGTGAMAFGRDADGRRGRSSGWGWLFGDEGSGYDVARRGLQAASKAYDGRGPDTELVAVAEDHFGLESFGDVFDEVYADVEHAKDIAPFAEPVTETAVNGDPVAERIIDEAADEIADAAIAVVDKLDLAPSPTVGCLGGLGSTEIVSARFEANVREAVPDATFVDPLSHPVVGTFAFVAEERGESITRADLEAMDAEIEALPSR